MHNEMKRMTVVFREGGAFTFELRPKIGIKKLAKGYGEFNGKRVECELQVKINKE